MKSTSSSNTICNHLPLDNAYREGRARYVCRNCGEDVSLLWYIYQLAKEEKYPLEGKEQH